MGVCIILARCNVVNKPKVSSVVENARSQFHKGERDLINFVEKIRTLKRMIGGIELKKNGLLLMCVDLWKSEKDIDIKWVQCKVIYFLTKIPLILMILSLRWRVMDFFFYRIYEVWKIIRRSGTDRSWKCGDKIFARKLLRDFEDSF